MSLEGIQDILNKIAKAHPQFAKRIKEASALSKWDTAVGPAISRHTRAIRILDGILWVYVDHAVWKSELHHRKNQILKVINQSQEGDEKVIKDIRFVDRYE